MLRHSGFRHRDQLGELLRTSWLREQQTNDCQTCAVGERTQAREKLVVVRRRNDPPPMHLQRIENGERPMQRALDTDARPQKRARAEGYLPSAHLDLLDEAACPA